MALAWSEARKVVTSAIWYKRGQAREHGTLRRLTIDRRLNPLTVLWRVKISPV